MIKAILKKPLDGKPEGSTVEFDKADFEMLEGLGAVERAPDDEGEHLGDDGGSEKAAPVPENKMADAPLNKAAKPAAKAPKAN